MYTLIRDRFLALLLLIGLLVGIFTILSSSSCSRVASHGDEVPRFVKVGKSYDDGAGTMLVQEIDPSGWVKVLVHGKVTWLKFSKIDALREAD